MIYALVFAVFAAYLATLAVLLAPWGLPLLWPSLSFALVAVAYAGAGPRLFGKRPDGRLAWWAVVLLLPFLLFAWGVWHLQRLGKEAPAHEVAPGLWLGRRPLPHEVPPEVGLIVDLTVEFVALARVRAGREYRSLPTLDTHVPPEGRLRELVAEVAEWP